MNKEIRCEWAKSDVDIIYHDKEWGVASYDDAYLFEMLILEGFQAGLSWNTILVKRDNFKKAFDNFDYHKISKYDDEKLESLMQDKGIIRNRLKIQSAKKNALAFIEVQKEFESFSKYIWGFVDGKQIVNHWKKIEDAPVQNELSQKISKDLLKKGFKFVGPTIIYSYLQAIGIIDDHMDYCLCKRK